MVPNRVKDALQSVTKYCVHRRHHARDPLSLRLHFTTIINYLRPTGNPFESAFVHLASISDRPIRICVVADPIDVVQRALIGCHVYHLCEVLFGRDPSFEFSGNDPVVTFNDSAISRHGLNRVLAQLEAARVQVEALLGKFEVESDAASNTASWLEERTELIVDSVAEFQQLRHIFTPLMPYVAWESVLSETKHLEIVMDELNRIRKDGRSLIAPAMKVMCVLLLAYPHHEWPIHCLSNMVARESVGLCVFLIELSGVARRICNSMVPATGTPCLRRILRIALVCWVVVVSDAVTSSSPPSPLTSRMYMPHNPPVPQLLVHCTLADLVASYKGLFWLVGGFGVPDNEVRFLKESGTTVFADAIAKFDSLHQGLSAIEARLQPLTEPTSSTPSDRVSRGLRRLVASLMTSMQGNAASDVPPVKSTLLADLKALEARHAAEGIDNVLASVRAAVESKAAALADGSEICTKAACGCYCCVQ